jgi:hypothetical protein
MLARPLALATLLAAAALTLALACNRDDEALEDAPPDASPTPSAPAPDGDATSTPAPDAPISTTPTPDDPEAPVTSTPGAPSAGGTPLPPPTSPPGASDDPDLPRPPGTIEEPARIVGIELLIAESFPPQYFVSVTSAQPNGCTRFSRFAVERHGPLIEVTVYNTVPANPAVVLCTAIYGETTSNVALGSDFEPGASYTLSVNGEQQSFVAQ